MQATIGIVSLKPFTKALACLCRYGDEITIHPTAEWLSLSVQGAGNTSFCRFKFLRTFFDRGYRAGEQTTQGRKETGAVAVRGEESDEDGIDATFLDEAVNSGEENEVQQVYGMVTGKLVLSVLRGSAAEKSAEKCYLQFVEGIEPSLQSSEEDSIETRLLLKLQYKHGTHDDYRPLLLSSSLSYVSPSTRPNNPSSPSLPTHPKGVIKTHTFSLSGSPKPQAPHLPPNRPISSVRIGGRTLKELIEHFPKPDRGNGGARGGDPLLVWQFYDDKACIRTEDRWTAARGEWSGGGGGGGSAGKGGRKGGRLVLGEDNAEEGESLIYSTVNSQLTLEEADFEAYDIYYAPVTLGIHLKELNATLAVAEALGSDIVLRFTASGQPIFFSLESSMGTYNAFCALSTKAVKEAREDGKQPVFGGAANGAGGNGGINNEAVQRKRQREFEGFDGARHPSKRKTIPGPAANAESTSNGMRTPVGFAPSTSAGSRPRSGSHVYVETSGADSDNDGGLSFAGVATSTQPRDHRHRPEYTEEEEPLFLPEASQFIDGQMEMEPPASQVLRDAGLQDFERMSQMELRAMLEDDDEEMNEITGGFGDTGGAGDDVEMGEVGKVPGERGGVHYAPTQPSREDDFRPLFED